jgi:hypothetical protein
MGTMTRETIAAMINAKEEGRGFAPCQRNLPFELYIQGNIRAITLSLQITYKPVITVPQWQSTELSRARAE